MTSIIDLILKPLPSVQRVVAQELQPLYTSEVLRTFFEGNLKISREAQTFTPGASRWEMMDILKPHFHPRCSSVRLVTALPCNDVLRPIPGNAQHESVWMLMAYLCELGPIDVSIIANVSTFLKGRWYIAWWGRLPGMGGQQLYLIHERTRYTYLQAMVENALFLVSQPV